ncbi:uncharacterized protein LOC9655216 [Selaginella moellendorffii]|nr:uncharacterized protein LOC9655216 [Selaginella moellendorffii]|eukprot:XP_002963687.2 uncharacterized protein LOC9655216 [Selaginella moellendorffii]
MNPVTVCDLAESKLKKMEGVREPPAPTRALLLPIHPVLQRRPLSNRVESSRVFLSYLAWGAPAAMGLWSLLAILTAALAALSSLANARKLLDTSNGGEKYGKVMGYVVCDACREKNLTSNSVFLSGMTVSLTCKAVGGQRPFFTAQQATDEQGRFSLDIPSQISGSGDGFKLCAASVAAGEKGITPLQRSCNVAAMEKSHSSLTPYTTIEGHRIFSTGPFVYTPSKSLQSIKSCGESSQDKAKQSKSDASSSSHQFGEEKAPAFPSFPNFGNPLSFPPVSFPNFGGIPSSPASQFPITSLFPPIPANPPPLLSQVPPLAGLPPFLGFPQLPAFQFPFFAAPPPPGN